MEIPKWHFKGCLKVFWSIVYEDSQKPPETSSTQCFKSLKYTKRIQWSVGCKYGAGFPHPRHQSWHSSEFRGKINCVASRGWWCCANNKRPAFFVRKQRPTAVPETAYFYPTNHQKLEKIKVLDSHRLWPCSRYRKESSWEIYRTE